MMFGLATLPRRLCVSQRGGASVSSENCRSDLRSEARSQVLLRRWLTPDQAEQYDRYQLFEVVGSHTGTRYRICHGTTMNIEELAAEGCVTRRWCFAPEGALAIGDVMLAQKVALETFELDALAIANHDGPLAAAFPRGSILHLDELGRLVLALACFATLVWSLFQIIR
jgi:hypothetical protein